LGHRAAGHAVRVRLQILVPVPAWLKLLAPHLLPAVDGDDHRAAVLEGELLVGLIESTLLMVFDAG
jgi:hypothetical protein